MAHPINPESIQIADFDFPLPEARIPLFPVSNRQESKLLHYRSGKIEDYRFYQLPDLMHAGDCLVFNDTKVIRARFHFKKDTGADIEVFLLEPVFPADYSQNFQSTSTVSWQCLIGNSKRWKSGVLVKDIELGNQIIRLEIERISSAGTAQIVQFAWKSGHSFSEILEAGGEIPLPPYIHRENVPGDSERYQTVYAKVQGSVAAPTAGLHFTPDILGNLENKSVMQARVTLHVGAGTFKPVSSASVSEHEMHSERFQITKETLLKLQNAQSITAVGTTSVRTLESLPYLAAIIASGSSDFHITQWMPYQTTKSYSKSETLSILLTFMNDTQQEVLEASTAIMILPGFNFIFIDSLITNFHLPKSTLLLLVSALVGDDWRMIYEHALQNEYRFLSYGDSSLLHRKS